MTKRGVSFKYKSTRSSWSIRELLYWDLFLKNKMDLLILIYRSIIPSSTVVKIDKGRIPYIYRDSASFALWKNVAYNYFCDIFLLSCGKGCQ